MLLAISAGVLSCSSAPAAAGSPGDSPTEAYKRLFAAVKSKNVDAIKAEMTENTLQFAQMVAAKQNTPIEKVFENGFTGTTFATDLPQMRDQRVADDMGNVEVWNTRDSKWEDLPFIKENGAWKLAVGDLFKGSFKSPGPGKDQREKMAANAANGNSAVQMPEPAANAQGSAPANSNVAVPAANFNSGKRPVNTAAADNTKPAANAKTAK